MPVAVADRHLNYTENTGKTIMPPIVAKVIAHNSRTQSEPQAGVQEMIRIFRNCQRSNEKRRPTIDQRTEMSNVLGQITRKIGCDSDLQQPRGASVDVTDNAGARPTRVKLQKPKIIVNTPVAPPTPKPAEEPKPSPLEMAKFGETGLVSRQRMLTFFRQYHKFVAAPTATQPVSSTPETRAK